MVTLKELMGKTDYNAVPDDHKANIMVLLEKMNKVRDAYGKPMVVTSGYRTKDDHIRVYKELFKKRKQIFDEKKIPWGSKHLSGAACDIHDPKGDLYKWCQSNEHLLENIGLWLEEADDQKRVHFQVKPYGSWVLGKSRFFKP